MTDLIIPVLIVLGFVVIVAYSVTRAVNEASRDEDAEMFRLYDVPPVVEGKEANNAEG